jgi:hypothetical protein
MFSMCCCFREKSDIESQLKKKQFELTDLSNKKVFTVDPIDEKVKRLHSELDSTMNNAIKAQRRNCIQLTTMSITEVGHTITDISTGGNSLPVTIPSRITAYSIGVSQMESNQNVLHDTKKRLNQVVKETLSLPESKKKEKLIKEVFKKNIEIQKEYRCYC